MQDFVFYLGAALRVFSLYFLFIALFTIKKRRPFEKARPQTRFAVLIPARNEAAVIERSVSALLAQRYPRALYDIYVLPNGCTDDTAARALRAGVKTLTCTMTSRKGDALEQAMARLMDRGYDAFCVFDADNVPDPDYLARMNDALTAGARVCKGRIRASNPYDSWVTGCYALYFSSFHLFYDRARANTERLSAKLVGTGLVVHRQVLESMGGFHTQTFSEDAEFAAQCAAMGERVVYVPEAVTYDEQPLSFGLSLRQRRRWCSGVLEVAKRMLPILFSRANRSAIAADNCVFLLSPFVQAVSLLCGLWLFCANLLAGNYLLLLSLPIGYLGTAALGLGLAAYERLDRRIWKSVLLYPLFTASFLPLQLLALLSRSRSWKPIPHGKDSVARQHLAA